MKKSKSKSGCLIYFIAFLIFCGIIGLLKSCFSDNEELQLEWQKENVSITDSKYTQTVRLNVHGKFKADELDEKDIEINISDKNVCQLEYKDANYAYIEFKVNPIKNGTSTVTVKYKDIESDKAKLTITIPEVNPSKESSKNSKKTTTRTTTRITTTTTQEITKPAPTSTTIRSVPQIIYLLNPESMKIHMENCRTIKHPENFQQTSDYNSAINQGYTPCGVCFR